MLYYFFILCHNLVVLVYFHNEVILLSHSNSNNSPSNKTILNMLKKVPLFSEVSPDGLQEILNKISFTRLAPEQILFREGDVGTSMYIIVQGKIKIFNTSSKGDEKTIAIFKSGDSFGELALIDGEPRSASAKALSFCELIKLDSFSFHELLQENYYMARAIMIELSKRIRKTNAQVHDLVFLDAKTQVVKTLITLANEHGQRVSPTVIKIDLPLTNTEIANLSGISTEVVGHVVNYLIQREFLSIKNGKYYLDLSHR